VARGDDTVPVVAVVGRPNVGKSSLVNRILGRREAIVQADPGVTRDRRSFIAEWAGREFEIFDTGGLEAGAAGLAERVAEQARVALQAADVVVLVVDSQTGPLEDDAVVADMLRKSGTGVVVAANKADDSRDDPSAAAFHGLGLGPPRPVSALHGRGSGDLLDEIVRLLPDRRATPLAEWASMAIIGRPNVGKSSLLNALIGEDRSIVDPAPGTTRDPIDSHLELGDGRTLRVVDTAGMRREVRINDDVEYYGFLRARRVLFGVDAAVLVVDIAEGVTGHDQRLAQLIQEAGRACVVVLNKWDLLGGDEIDRRRLERDVTTRLGFVPWARIVRTSALTGRGVGRIVPAIAGAVEAHRVRLPTSEVNRLVSAAQDHRPHPRVAGRSIRILYSVQSRVSPPTFVLFGTGRVETSYLRYLERRIRAAAGFEGSPIRLEVKGRREL
jgi:GTPase